MGYVIMMLGFCHLVFGQYLGITLIYANEGFFMPMARIFACAYGILS